MALYLELDNQYDPNKLIKFPKVSLTSKIEVNSSKSALSPVLVGIDLEIIDE